MPDKRRFSKAPPQDSRGRIYNGVGPCSAFKMPCAFRLDHPLRAGPGCQFPESELVDLFNGQTWCRFHLPIRVEDEETPKARWEKVEIEAFNGAIFALLDAAREGRCAADLSGVVFPADISFESYAREQESMPGVLALGAIFGGHANFANLKFDGSAHFDGTTFGAQAFFCGVEFCYQAFFGAVMFNDVDFSHANFTLDAHFVRATFSGSADFRGVEFGNYITFERARFESIADFRQAKLPNFTTFRRGEFKNEAFFSNASFLDSTDFRDVIFDVAPQFHNALLHPDTRFSGTVFRDRKGSDEVDAASAYRTLKLAMEGLRARDEEARFYAYEQQSLRAKEDTPRLVCLFSFLYEKTTNYGQSISRPLLWLVGMVPVFWLVYAMLLFIHFGPIDTLVLPKVDFENLSWFTLQQVFRPFEVFRSREAAVIEALKSVPWYLALAAAIHSLATLSLLTLFLLALRRRFKLD